jgi:hypothetical protein
LLCPGFKLDSFSFSHANVGIPVQINLAITTSWDLEENEMFTLTMPKFTDGRDVSAMDNTYDQIYPNYTLVIEPNTKFEAAWLQGNFNNNTYPFLDAKIYILKKEGISITKNTHLKIKIYAENGLRAYCGFPAYDAYRNVESVVGLDQFILTSNITDRPDGTSDWGTFRNPLYGNVTKVCMCVYMYICTYVYICVCILMCVYICVRMHVKKCAYCIFECSHT